MLLFSKLTRSLSLSFLLQLSLTSFCQISKAQLGQSDWVKPGQASQQGNPYPSQTPSYNNQAGQMGQLGQSDWVKPSSTYPNSYPSQQTNQPPYPNPNSYALGPGQAQMNPDPNQYQQYQQTNPYPPNQQFQGMQNPAYQQTYQQNSGLSQSGWVQPGQQTNQSSTQFQMPTQIEQELTPQGFNQGVLDGEISQNVYTQQAPTNYPNPNPNPNQNPGMIQAPNLGNFPMQASTSPESQYDSLGKAISQAAQMGLIPGSGNNQNNNMKPKGLSLPKFGTQMGGRPAVVTRPSGGGGGNYPGAGLTRTVNGAVNYGVHYATRRAIIQGLNRAIRF